MIRPRTAAGRNMGRRRRQPMAARRGPVMAIQDYICSLESLLERSGARLVRTSLPPSVHGRTSSDQITLRDDLSPEQQFATLVHELAHWLAHREQAPDAHAQCTVFEYEAEAVEALVMARLGLSIQDAAAPGAVGDSPTDDLLPLSVRRVVWASGRICHALGLELGR